MGESTKYRSGARIVGIVTASNRADPALWEALADCDLAEFRADGFDASGVPAAAREFREECRRRFGRPMETILTLRLERDGGRWPDAEAAARVPVWEVLGLDGSDPLCEWLDIEIEEIADLPAGTRELLSKGSARLLLSHHDMSGTLSRDGLRELLRRMQSHRPAGVKFAMTCGDRDRLLDLLAFSREVASATPAGCVLSMGRIGRASRVLAPLLGCPLTYGYLTGGAVAPGQLSVRELRAFFRSLGPGDAEAARNGGETGYGLLDWAEARIEGESLAE